MKKFLNYSFKIFVPLFLLFCALRRPWSSVVNQKPILVTYSEARHQTVVPFSFSYLNDRPLSLLSKKQILITPNTIRSRNCNNVILKKGHMEKAFAQEALVWRQIALWSQFISAYIDYHHWVSPNTVPPALRLFYSF